MSNISQPTLSRRNFLAGAAASLVGLAGATSLAGCAPAAKSTEETDLAATGAEPTLKEPTETREADIVVCATGRARAYGAEYFSPGQTVLDVGINFDEAGNLCGDVDFDAVVPVLGDGGAITPVPRGLGGVTTSVTMAHVVQAAEAGQR